MATDLERLTVSLEANVKKFEREIARARGVAVGALADVQKQASSFEGAIDNAFKRAASIISGAVVAREIQKLADTWQEATNKIRSAGVGDAMASSVQNEIADIAARSRTGFADVADLYARLTRTGKDFGATQGEVAVATETVSKALKVSGASASEVQSTLVQLGQALGSGKLQGDELRSLLENAPVVAQAIAKEFGVAIGSLKDLGAEGKLTSDRVFRALVNAAPEVGAAFAKTNATIADSFKAVETAALKFVGNSNSMSVVAKTLSGGLQGVATNFDAVATGAGALGAVIATRLVAQGLSPMVMQMGLAVSSGAAVSSGLAAMGTRAAIAGQAVTALRMGLALIGGPVGAAILGTAAIVTYLATRSDEGRQSTDRYAAALAALQPPAEAAKVAIKGVGDQVAETSQRMTDAAQSNFSQKLKQDAVEASNLTTTIRGAVAGLEQYGAVGLKSEDKKRGLDLVKSGLEGDEKAAIAAANELRLLGETNISFASAFASIATMLTQLASVRAAAAATRAALAGVQAEQEDESKTKARRDEQSALERSGFKPDTALPNVNSDPILAGLRLQSKVREAQMDEDAKKLKDKTKQLYEAALGEGGGVSLADAEAAAKKIIAAEDAGKGGGGGGSEKEKATALERYVINLQKAGELAKADLATAGLANVEREKARALVEATAAAQKDFAAGLRETAELTTAEKERILALAAATAQWKEEAKRVKDAMDFTSDLAKDAFKGLVSDLMAGKSAADALANALQKMASKLADKAIDSLFDGLLKGGSGGGSGLLGKLFGFADGGRVTGPGSGRSDSILARLSNGEFVVNARSARQYGPLLDAINRGKTPAFANGGMVGGASPSIMRAPSVPSLTGGGSRGGQSFAVAIDVRGATGNQEIQTMVRQGIAAGIQAYDRQLDRSLPGKLAVADARFG